MADERVSLTLTDRESMERIARAVIRDEQRARNVLTEDEGPDFLPSTATGQLFYNDSGETIPAWGLIFVKTTTPDTVGAEKALYGGKTSTTFGRDWLFNGPLPVSDGEYGRAQVGPNFKVLYDSGTPAVNEGWGPKPSQFTASKGFPGLTVRAILSTTAKIMLAQSHFPLTQLLCKTTGAITGGSASTSYRIYAGGTLGSEADAGWTTVPSALSLTDIATTKWIKLTFLANGWRMEPLECSE